ncbi:hypothetical protein [Pantoea agglomerans]|nr:hypothetical protein [Pantoea agglomerans]
MLDSRLPGYRTVDDYNESSELIEDTIAHAGQSQAEWLCCNKQE